MREVITIDGVEYRLRPLTRDAIAAAAAAGQAALLEQQRRAMASPDPRVVQTFVRQAQRFRRAATRFARGDWRSLATIVDAQTLCALAGVEPGDPRHTPALVDAILASVFAG